MMRSIVAARGVAAAATSAAVPALRLARRPAAVAAVAAAARGVRAFSDSSSSSSSSSSGTTDRFIPKPVYSSYKIYKSRTALDVSVVRALLGWNSARVEDRRYLSLKKPGGFRLTFASGENRMYNWEDGAVITLSVTELGDLISFAASKDQAEHKIFHDPLLGSDQAGQTRKELVVKRIGQGKPGYFFNFTVTSKEGGSGEGNNGGAAGQRKWSIAVSEGELQVVLTLAKQTLPDLLALTTRPLISTEDNAYGARRGDDANSSSSSSSQQQQQGARKRWNDAK